MENTDNTTDARQYGERYMAECKKCGYQWLARTPQPKRCPLCNNLNPDAPRKYKRYDL